MSHSQSVALQPYYGLIAEALDTRKAAAGDFESDPTHKVPRFVSRMCESIARACTERSGQAVDITQVLKVECLAAGHFDYHRKFALYCTELERGITNIRP